MQEHMEQYHRLCQTNNDPDDKINDFGTLPEPGCDILEDDFNIIVKGEEGCEDDCDTVIECDVKIKGNKILKHSANFSSVRCS